jgi:hypothetical protein
MIEYYIYIYISFKLKQVCYRKMVAQIFIINFKKRSTRETDIYLKFIYELHIKVLYIYIYFSNVIKKKNNK